MGLSRTYGWGLLFAVRAAIYIYVVGGRLTPDSGLYARGRAAWSSPATAFAGYLAGYQGVCLAGIAGAFALGAIVARNSRGVLPPLAVALLPPGWYAMEPSADASGAASAAYFTGKPWRNSFLLVVAAFHLEAALVILGARVVGSRFAVRLDFLAIGMGSLACLAQFHIQIRYLLPGLALMACNRRTFLGRSSKDFTTPRIPLLKTSASQSLKPRWYWEP